MGKQEFWSLILLFIILWGGAEWSSAQNLVRNPGFEQIDECPTDLGQLEKTTFWSSVGKTKADLWASCLKDNLPADSLWRMTPTSGGTLAGFFPYKKNSTKCDTVRMERNFLAVRLSEPLKTGEQYCIRMKAALSVGSSAYLDSLSVFFSPSMPSMYNIGNPSASLAFEYAGKTENWLPLQGGYTALGGEEYMYIGFSGEPSILKPIPDLKTIRQNVYLYLEDVCLVDVAASWSCDCGSFERKFLKKETIRMDLSMAVPKNEREITLSNIYFEKGKSSLLPSSFPIMNGVAYVLSKTSTPIFVEGHTDDLGGEAYNQKLSQFRAEAVRNYLVSKGISPSRIQAIGKGQLEPVIPNTSDENRAMNRRVVFKF